MAVVVLAGLCLGGLVGQAQAEVPCQSCQKCGPSGHGETTPCGDTGCGPRYRGPRHDEPGWPDPCDECNSWRDCNGVSRPPEMLAPWQRAPGRGFQAPEEVGYIVDNPCDTCHQCCLWKWLALMPGCGWLR